MDDWSEFHERVKALPPPLREAFELVFYNGLTRKAAAEVLGVSEKTVRRRWYEARDRIGRAADETNAGDNGASQSDPPDKDDHNP
jgi:RNA polymerase sigma factor (sigma-70 family)